MKLFRGHQTEAGTSLQKLFISDGGSPFPIVKTRPGKMFISDIAELLSSAADTMDGCLMNFFYMKV